MKKVLIFVLINLAAFAGSVFSLPIQRLNCSPLKSATNGLESILPGPSKPTDTEIYFFKNISVKGIWLDHTASSATAKAGWSSFLRPNHWSAILLNRKNFSVRCASIQPGKVNYLNCTKVLYICIPEKNSDIKTKHANSYWLVEDQPWDKFIKLYQHRMAPSRK